jgi:hypothetical protein
MSGHRPFSELIRRDPRHDDPERVANRAAYGRMLEDIVTLSELRAQRGVSQERLARALEVSQAHVSRVEHRDHLYVDTVRAYVEALGGRLHLIAEFPDQTIPLSIGLGPGTPEDAHATAAVSAAATDESPG